VEAEGVVAASSVVLGASLATKEGMRVVEASTGE